MTCIVGLVDEGVVYIGGDSAGVGGFSMQIRKDEKVFRNGAFIMGFTTSFRMGQLLRYRFNPPKHHPSDDLVKFMSTDFIDAVRDCLKTYGYAQKDKDQESGGTFLVGFEKKLFIVDSDYQVGLVYDSFYSVGCGSDIALGAMFASVGAPPRVRITQALEAAERFSAGVRGPFIIEAA